MPIYGQDPFITRSLLKASTLLVTPSRKFLCLIPLRAQGALGGAGTGADGSSGDIPSSAQFVTARPRCQGRPAYDSVGEGRAS